MHAQPLDARMAHIEGSFDQFGKRLDSIDRRLDSIDRRFEQVDRRFEQLDRRFAQMDARFNYVDTRFNWVLGTVVASWFTIMATLVGTILTVVFHHQA